MDPASTQDQPAKPLEEDLKNKADDAPGSSNTVAQGLTSDWKWINQKELQTLVTRAADGSGVELAAKTTSSTGEDDSAGTFVRVVTESEPETKGSSSSGGGSRQIAHILLTPRTSAPPLEVSSSKGKSEAENKEVAVSGGDPDVIDLEKGLNSRVSAPGSQEPERRLGKRADEAGEEPVCRVCQFNLGPNKDAPINLGCACKLDLSHAHRECAETWFRVRGNRKCEICGEIAQNVQLADAPAATSSGDTTTITVVTVHHRYACQNKPVRVLLAFLVAAFLVPWLFRFAYRQ